jgi:hypothetical protein
MKSPSLALRIVLFLLLLGLPLAARGLWFYRGQYRPPQVASVEQARLDLAQPVYQPADDQPTPGDGRVLIDLSRTNNLAVDDLNPLKERLAARGAQVIFYDGLSESFPASLRRASALVVLAPASPYPPSEQALVRQFVADGGRLLLAADPTRPVPFFEPPVDLWAYFFPLSAIPAVNSLAGAFDISFYDDYVYNLVENAGNYRNVRFSPAQPANPLTEGVETVVFYAAHSLRGAGQAMFTGDENTRSPMRRGETGLAAALQAADGRLLAFGDLTFLTAPYFQTADNARLLSNLADWLAEDTRQWDQAEFPYLFQGPVTLVAGGPDGAIDPRLLASGGSLFTAFERAGLDLQVRAEAPEAGEAILLATYDRLAPVETLLETAGISITAVLSDTLLDRQQGSHTVAGTIAVEGFGRLPAQGSSLVFVDRSGPAPRLAVLAQDTAALLRTLDRLALADFSGCFTQAGITLCSTGELPAPQEGGAMDGGGLPEVLLLVDDARPGGGRSSAAELQAALAGQYAVKVWSTQADGAPAAADLAGYAAYIYDSGDYPSQPDDLQALTALFETGGNLLVIGEQPLPPEGALEPINDLQVVNAGHPLAAGLSPGQVIALSESLSGIPALVISPAELPVNPDGSESAVLQRGPNSPASGSPALFASTGGSARLILATFAFYRLPPEVQTTLALNLAAWLTGR